MLREYLRNADLSVTKYGFKAIAPLLQGMLLAIVFFVQAQPLSPLALVRVTVDEVIDDMVSQEQLYESKPEKLEEMVNTRIAPHFNVERMVKIAMASNWAEATPQQRERLAIEFKQMLIRSYTKVMFLYRHEEIIIQGQEQIRGNNAIVKLKVNKAGSAPTDLTIRMIKSNNQLQVIDVVVGDVSMLKSFRSNFSVQISNLGIDGLIDDLAKSNREGTE